MNKNGIYVAVFGVLCILAGALLGAGISRNAVCPFGRTKPAFTEKAERYMRYGPGMRHRVERMREHGFFDSLISKLDLNNDQQVKAKEIIGKTRDDIRAVGENVRASIDGIREKSKQQIMEILTPGQQEKFKQLLNDAEYKREHRMERPFAPPEPGNLPSEEGSNNSGGNK